MLFDLGPARRQRLLMVVHHLVVDGVSWRILLEDFSAACEALGSGRPVELPPKTSSFKSWAIRLEQYARSAELRRELAFWSRAPPEAVRPLDVDIAGGENTEASERRIHVALDAEETRRLLQVVPKAFHTQIGEVLLAALSWSFATRALRPALLVDLEGHGREPLFDDIDLSRTVGWFTTVFPVVLEVDPSASPEESVAAVKEQLRRVPNRGIGYGVLRYLSGWGDSDAWKALPQAQIAFNYLGQFDQTFSSSAPWTTAAESAGPSRSLRQTRPYLVDVNAIVINGRLQVTWAYSEAVHRRSTIEAIADGFLDALRAIVARAKSEPGGYAPSDFPLAGLDQSQLDRLISKLSRKERPLP